jgi:hypothetical protein
MTHINPWTLEVQTKSQKCPRYNASTKESFRRSFGADGD